MSEVKCTPKIIMPSTVISHVIGNQNISPFIMVYIGSVLLFASCVEDVPRGMFADMTRMIDMNTSGWYSGVTVTDVDHDGNFDYVIARQDGANVVLSFDEHQQMYKNIADVGTPFSVLRDEQGRTTSVCACDIDGDGVEEIYFHNDNDVYVDQVLQPDRLYRWTNDSYLDLFADDINSPLAPRAGGYAVACLDRHGSGEYGILVTTYNERAQGMIVLIEMDSNHESNTVDSGRIILKDSAEEAGLQSNRDGLAIAVGPILNDYGDTDIVVANAESLHRGSFHVRHNGNNTMYKNTDGVFQEVTDKNVWDSTGDSRGVTLSDLNNDGRMDVIVVDWLGSQQIFLQTEIIGYAASFKNVAPNVFATPSPATSVVAADFDNDILTEIFINTMPLYYSWNITFHKLFRTIPHAKDVFISQSDFINQQTGGKGQVAVADLNRDGLQELLITGGQAIPTGITLYKPITDSSTTNKWLKILPLGRHGAPGRGVTVTITLANEMTLHNVIGVSPGIEPVAHFGLGSNQAISVDVRWQRGKIVRKFLSKHQMNKLLIVHYSGKMEEKTWLMATDTSIGQVVTNTGAAVHSVVVILVVDMLTVVAILSQGSQFL